MPMKRAYRELALLTQTARAHTGAADAVVRMALALWAADVRATISAAQRQWVIARLGTEDGAARPLTAKERARLRDPLMAYITTYHPRIAEIVRAQFTEEEA